MDGDKKICAMGIGKRHPFFQRNINIPVSRHDDLKPILVNQFISQYPCDSQHDIFFVDAVRTGRTRILTTVTRIKTDRKILCPAPGRTFRTNLSLSSLKDRIHHNPKRRQQGKHTALSVRAEGCPDYGRCMRRCMKAGLSEIIPSSAIQSPVSLLRMDRFVENQ